MNSQFDFNYYGKESPSEIVNYILGYMVYVSLFFISIKLITINMDFSILLLCFISLLSIIIINNINKYGIFDVDTLIFKIIYLTFTGFSLINFLSVLSSGIFNNWGLIFFYVLIILLIINSIFMQIQLKNCNVQSSVKKVFSIISFTCTLIFIMLIFTCIYISTVNKSIHNYTIKNFTYNNEQNLYYANNAEYLSKDYISYANRQKMLKYVELQNYKNLTRADVETITKIHLHYLDKVEDYLLFSTTNQFSGSTNNTFVFGSIIKYTMILQKITTILMLMIIINSIFEMNK